MTITHRKKVKTQLSKHIRNENICILVLLVRIARLVSDRSSKCKFSDAIKSLWCYFHGDFPSWLLVILRIPILVFNCLSLLVRLILVIIWLLKVLLSIFDLSALTVLQKILLSEVFIKILLASLLIFSRSCTYSFLRRISLLFILRLNIFSLKLYLL